MTGEFNYSPFETDKEKAKIWLQSIIYDGTSTWGKGADKGYASFIEAFENIEFYDIETDSEPYLNGIAQLDELSNFDSPEAMVESVYNKTKQLLETEKFLTFFGGEHSVSIGIMRAFRERYEDFSVLQIDAHSDLRQSYNGSKNNHACAMHEINQHCNVVQVGIRAMDKSELSFMNKEQVYFAKEIQGDNKWMDTVCQQLTKNVYITFDVDALDPSIMPATGTPEPGGLYYYQVLDLLKKVFESRDVVGFDIVEFAPISNLHFPQNLIANLYYKMLAYKFNISF